MYRLTGYSLVDDISWIKERENTEYIELQNRLKKYRTDLEALSLDAGVKQTEILTKLINDYHAVVETRFFGKKSTSLTYLDAARTVQKHAIHNLADIVAVGHSLSSLSRTGRSVGQINNSQQKKRVEKRGELADNQLARIDLLLEENSKLFHALTETAVEVANMRSLNEFDRTDALARLVMLAQITNTSTS